MNVYPSAVRGLTFTVTRSAGFSTDKQTSPSKIETRVQNMINPLWTWKLMYSYLLDRPWMIQSSLINTDLRVLLDFFLAASGQFNDFLFLDPDDNYVGPAMNGSTPNTPLAQLQIVNDGAGNYYSPIQRTFGGLFYEDITDLNLSTGTGGAPLVVYANGVLQELGGVSPNYSVLGPGLSLPGASYAGMYLKWTAEPTPPITAQFGFYFRVHWGTDSQDFEKFMNELWCVGGDHSRNSTGMLTLESSRPTSI